MTTWIKKTTQFIFTHIRPKAAWLISLKEKKSIKIYKILWFLCIKNVPLSIHVPILLSLEECTYESVNPKFFLADKILLDSYFLFT